MVATMQYRLNANFQEGSCQHSAFSNDLICKKVSIRKFQCSFFAFSQNEGQKLSHRYQVHPCFQFRYKTILKIIRRRLALIRIISCITIPRNSCGRVDVITIFSSNIIQFLRSQLTDHHQTRQHSLPTSRKLSYR